MSLVWLGMAVSRCLDWSSVRMVRDNLAENGGVRHQHLHVLRGSQLRRAYANILDDADLLLNTNRVSNSERSLQQQVHAAEKVLQDVLDGQAESQADGASDSQQSGRIDAEDSQNDQ